MCLTACLTVRGARRPAHDGIHVGYRVRTRTHDPTSLRSSDERASAPNAFAYTRARERPGLLGRRDLASTLAHDETAGRFAHTSHLAAHVPRFSPGPFASASPRPGYRARALRRPSARAHHRGAAVADAAHRPPCHRPSAARGVVHNEPTQARQTRDIGHQRQRDRHLRARPELVRKPAADVLWQHREAPPLSATPRSTVADQVARGDRPSADVRQGEQADVARRHRVFVSDVVRCPVVSDVELDA